MSRDRSRGGEEPPYSWLGDSSVDGSNVRPLNRAVDTYPRDGHQHRRGENFHQLGNGDTWVSTCPDCGKSHAEQYTEPQPAGPVLGTRRLKVTRASEVQPRRIRWCWSQRIVVGGLTLLAGREGLGKSSIAMSLTAQLTRGGLDGEHFGTPRTVIYVHTEDARDYTIVPRLIAAGADLDRVVFLDAVTTTEDGDSESPLVLPHDTTLLADIIREHGAAMVVLDAATSVIDSKLDGDKDRQMRQGLERIARVGETTGAAMLGLVHFGKRDSGDTGKLILGSIAWSQVARSVLAVAADEDSGQLVVSTTKGNLGPGAPSMAARIVSHEVPTDEGVANVGLVEWVGETSHDARDFLRGVEDDPRSEVDEAGEWLQAFLDDNSGSVAAGEVIKAAKRDGIAERTLQRARKRAGITSRKTANAWVWDSPDQGATDDGALTDTDQGATGGTP